MSSLRARLLAAVLAIAAVGLLALAAITYAEQRVVPARPRSTRPRARARARSPARSPSRGSGSTTSPTATATTTAARRAAAAPASACRPAPTASCGRSGVRHPILFDYGQNIAASPKIPAKVERRQAEDRLGRRQRRPRYRLVASSLGHGDIAVVAVPLTEVDRDAQPARPRRGPRDRRRAARARRPSAGSSCATACSRSTASATPPGGSRAATSPTASRSTDERTEVGRVGAALNRMLDRLEQAFTERRASEDRLRQFIADASHELRTPLASIRGYAELHRMGAARSDEDVEKAMRRIEDEAARMGVLVEDLLTLARLDEVADAPHAEVDLAHLARDTVADAHATAPGRPIAVHADGPARRARRRPPAAPGARQPRPQRARPHPGRQPGRGQRRPRGRRGAARGPRPRPRPPHRRPERAVRALLARRGRARARQVRRRARAGDRGRHRRRPRRPRERRPTPTAAARPSSSCCPPRSRSAGSQGAPGRITRRGPMLAPMSPPSRDRRPRLQRGARARPEHPPPARLPLRRLPVQLADRDRRQREHRRDPGDRPRARARAARRLAPAARREGPRPGAARRVVGEPRGRRRLHGRRPLAPTCARCCRSSRRCSPATPTSPSARAWPAARGWCAGRSAS